MEESYRPVNDIVDCGVWNQRHVGYSQQGIIAAAGCGRLDSGLASV